MFSNDHAEETLKWAKEHFENMTDEEYREGLIRAGIIYKNGRHTPPYRIIDEYFDKFKKEKKKKEKNKTKRKIS